jgi:hypothetical protein
LRRTHDGAFGRLLLARYQTFGERSAARTTAGTEFVARKQLERRIDWGILYDLEATVGKGDQGTKDDANPGKDQD